MDRTACCDVTFESRSHGFPGQGLGSEMHSRAESDLVSSTKLPPPPRTLEVVKMPHAESMFIWVTVSACCWREQRTSISIHRISLPVSWWKEESKSKFFFMKGNRVRQKVSLPAAGSSKQSVLCCNSRKKVGGGKKRAGRHAASVIHQVDRARMDLNLDKLLRKEARLLPQAVLEELDSRIRSKQWQEALKIFELLRRQIWYEPRAEPYIRLITLLGKMKQPARACELFDTMLKEKVPPSVEAYTALLSAYVEVGDLDEALELVERMKTQENCFPDVYTYSKLIDGYCRAARLVEAEALLLEMSKFGVAPNVVTYNSILQGYEAQRNLERMENFFTSMLREKSPSPDLWSWNILFKALGNRGEIGRMQKWYDHMVESEKVVPNIVTMNTLINVYGQHGDFDRMEKVRRHMVKWYFRCNELTFNTIIKHYGNAKRIADMELAYLDMKRSGVKPSAFTMTYLLTAYTRVGRWAGVEKVRREWKNSDLHPDVYLYNALLKAYSKMGNFDKLQDVYDEMCSRGIQPDSTTDDIFEDAFRSGCFKEFVGFR